MCIKRLPVHCYIDKSTKIPNTPFIKKKYLNVEKEEY